MKSDNEQENPEPKPNPFSQFYDSEEFQKQIKGIWDYKEKSVATPKDLLDEAYKKVVGHLDKQTEIQTGKDNVAKANKAIPVDKDLLESAFEPESVEIAEFVAEMLNERLLKQFPNIPKEYILSVTLYATLYMWALLEKFIKVADDDNDGKPATDSDSPGD